MPIARFEMPDGRIARFEVPEGTTPEQANAQIQDMLAASSFGRQPDAPEPVPAFSQDEYLRSLNESMSTPAKLAVGFQKGLRTIGRGVGLMDDEDPTVQRGLGMLSQDTTAGMLGDVAGLAAGALPAILPVSGAGMATSGGRVLIPAAEKLLTRIGLGAATGAAEGAVIARGEGRDANQQILAGAGGATLGGAVEVLIPVLGRLGRGVFNALGRKPKGPLITAAGAPTQELLVALKETGTTFDALTDDAVDFIASQRAGSAPDEVARLARFKSQGIRATKGDISQKFTDQAAESRLMSMATNDAAEPLRQYKLSQSQDFQGAVDTLVDSLGVPSEAGTSIKAALTGRKDLLRSQKNALYKQAADASPELNNVPIFGDTILSALPDKRTMRRIGRMEGSQIKALQDLLVEFGIDNTDDAVKAFTAAGDEITPLTLGNLEDFRAGLNMIKRADKTGAASVAVGPVLDALDGEADELAKALGDKGFVMGEDLLETLKQARSTTRNLKTEFSPNALAGRLTGMKPDGVTPMVEASNVARELSTKPIEQMRLTLSSLHKSGDAGRKAIGDMQASVVLEALEAGLKAPSRKTAGIETVGGNQFAKHLDKFGDDRLALLFKGNDKALTALMSLKQTGLDMMPADRAVPKGSAPVIMDLMKRLGRAPMIAAVVEMAQFVLKAGGDERAVARAMKAKPEWALAASEIERMAPSVFTAMGLAGVASNIEEPK